MRIVQKTMGVVQVGYRRTEFACQPALGGASLRASLAFLVLLSATLASCATTSQEDFERALRRAEMGRDAADPALRRALDSGSPSRRVQGLRAIARIGNAREPATLFRHLEDGDTNVATWAAFALREQAQTEEAAATLMRALKDGRVRHTDEILLGLGHIATASLADSLADFLVAKRATTRAHAALALGLLKKRNQKLSGRPYVEQLGKLVDDADAGNRYGAAYALMRFSDPSAALKLIPLVADADPEIRALAVAGIGQGHLAVDSLDASLADRDWRVRVEAAKALGAIGTARDDMKDASLVRLLAMAKRELSKMETSDDKALGIAAHVLLAIVRASADIGVTGTHALLAIDSDLSRLTNAKTSDRARIQCAIAVALDEQEKRPTRVKNCGDTSLLAWRRLELETRVLKIQGEDGIPRLLELVAHADSRVRVAAATALSSMEAERAMQVTLQLLSAKDPVVVSAVADSIASWPANAHDMPGLVHALDTVLGQMVAVDDPSLVVSVLDAIGALKARATSVLSHLESVARDPRPAVAARAKAAWTRISGASFPRSPAGHVAQQRWDASIPGRIQVRLVTTRGDFVMALFGDVAPRTVQNFVALVRSGAYRQKTFHRVVSGFVVQGGCPRGDGWGLVGETILDEFSPLPFSRGAVGIATSGKDTGGSQFFIMHARHPHLEGRYTLFGQVVSGMDVVDALGEDDSIQEATIEP